MNIPPEMTDSRVGDSITMATAPISASPRADHASTDRGLGVVGRAVILAVQPATVMPSMAASWSPPP